MKPKHRRLIVLTTICITAITGYSFYAMWTLIKGYTECTGEAQEFCEIPRLGNTLHGFKAEGPIKYQVIAKYRWHEIHLVAHLEEGGIDEGLKAHPELELSTMWKSSNEEPDMLLMDIVRELDPESLKHLSGDTLDIGGGDSVYLLYNPESRILWGNVLIQRGQGQMPGTHDKVE